MQTKNRVILVANDTPASLSAIAASLTEEGYTPLAVCDGHEVLRELQRSDVDLVALDVSMPVMDGVVTCRELRSNPDFSRLPVIIYGDLDDANRREESFRAGCNVYVSLTDPDGLLGPIEDLLGEATEPVFLDELAEPTVMVIDDDPQILRLLVRFLEMEGLRVVTGTSGQELDEKLATTVPDVIVLDVMLPGESGLDILQRLKSDPFTDQIPVVITSGGSERELVNRALENGADDYLAKPVDPSRLKARVNACLNTRRLLLLQAAYRQKLETANRQLENLVSSQTAQLAEAHLALVFAMSKLAESRDPETGAHLERLRAYCQILCQALLGQGSYTSELTPAFVDTIYQASPLHDIGKVGVPDSVLLKPGKLTADELEIMKTHTTLGAQTLLDVRKRCPSNRLIEMAVDITWAHHERWDGQGYPRGLAGLEIPLSARVLALGDVYDALTSRRPYKEALGHDESVAIIAQGRGTQFDPLVVAAFEAVCHEFLKVREAYSE